ncbi:MAG: type VI secretion system protein TssL [Granulosicoccus sp.]|nr:type VI secretion system protein TssL [Granulosicoccus sp.]
MGDPQMTDDPFAFDDDDRTVLRPGAGSRAQAPASAAGGNRHRQQALPPLGGINPLEKAASRLLPLLLTIRHSTTHPNPDQLRNRLIQELNDFKQAAHRILNDQKKVTQASYVMCTVLDEAAMNTPWGHQANWSQHNLLATFHNEVIGGERFFALLKGLGKNPKENIDLLELMYVCLSLGYEGTYRIAQNGQATLAKVRLWLYEIISSARPTAETGLSLHWQGSGVQESKLPKLTVLWVLAAAALAASSLIYIGYRYSLGSRSDEAIAAFFQIEAEPLLINSVAPPAAPPASSSTSEQVVTLEKLLQPQIDLGLLEVDDSFNEGKVRIVSDNLFASGRTELNPELEQLVQSIAQAMDQFSGSILVTGHSDNIPIRSGRFASNLELSQARAQSVAQRMATSLRDPTRLSAEGRGSLEPIADNGSASGRARNRRVEVSIFY